MKTLLRIIFGLLALLLIVALFISKDFNYKKSITINKPIEQVWEHTNSFASIDAWSPWSDYDSKIEKNIYGKDGSIGAKSTWKSDHPNVGIGSQIITKIEAPNLFATHIKFKKPYESELDSYIKLESKGNSTIVSWGFKSKMPYPSNLMKLIINPDETIGKDFSNGLQKLKVICEQ